MSRIPSGPLATPIPPVLPDIGAELLQPLAQSLDYTTYFHMAAALMRNHVFWSSLLPSAIGGAAVLVLENRLGALTLRLARMFRQVYSIPATAADADTMLRLLADAGVRNVRIMAADDIERDVPGGLGLIVLFGPFEPESPAAANVGRRLAEHLQANAERWLAHDGIVVTADNNTWSYRRWKRSSMPHAVSGRWSVWSLVRRARRQRAHIDCFVNRGELTRHLFPPPELVPLDAPVKTGGVRLKERILHSRWGRRAWPSYLCLCSRKSDRGSGELVRIVGASGVGESVGWARASALVVKRLIAGHGGITVAIVGPSTRHDSDVVVRLPGTADGVRRCETNIAALRHMADTRLAPHVPRPLAVDMQEAQRYYIETRCPGWDWETAGIAANQALDAAFALMWSFHEGATEKRPLSPEGYDEVVGINFSDLRPFLEPAHQVRLDAIETWVRSALCARPLHMGFTHGDFKLGNLLFAGPTTPPFVIDWDCSHPRGFPLLDYLTLLSYKLGHALSGRLQRAYDDQVLPWRLPPSDARLVERVVDAFGVNEREFLALRTLLGFAFLRDRHDRFIKFHATWRARHALPILDGVEREIERMERSGAR